ncbi:MAG: flagellar assembly peptidoglycan hydrolase FlgJ [Proteobacteria bacterium]|nr:flagellar assembly peptidoglycan hydrolase FlgJ [Pseudomonadota bacterium]
MSAVQPLGTLPAAATAAEAKSALDFSGLDALRTASQQAPQDPKTLRAVAQQFESLFIGMMLKSMRDAKLGDGLFDSHESRFYQDMFDQQLAQTLSQGRGLGIADLLVKSLTPPVPPPAGQGYGKLARRSGAAVPVAAAADVAAAGSQAAVEASAEAPPTEPLPEAPAAAAGATPDGAIAATPEEFVNRVLPSATAAARALGVSRDALIAQAALETNWGRQVPAGAAGSSYNLFGIKAGDRWDGRRVFKDTLEYTGGVPERRREPFRAYDSIAHGFQDYVAFVSGHDRYAEALRQGTDPVRYVSALQGAGYATDPAYSAKIAAVLRSDTFRSAVAGLKDEASEPIF